MEIIKTDMLTKFYGKSCGISELSLSVNEGEIFGFIGPNGAGKSTTERLLLGLIKPTAGTAHIFGLDTATNSCKILKDVGYMPSETTFYSGMTVKDTIKLSGNLREMDCSAEAEKLCVKLNLDVNKKTTELSLGNRKKVGIVCAMQHKPKLYIFDEPTSGLDPLVQKQFWELVNERRDNGATVFLSSHVLSEIQKNCDRAAIIKEGKMIACDSVENLSDTGVKKVTLHGVSNMPEIDGVKPIKSENGKVTFLFGGNIKNLISYVDKTDFTDITIAEPELDEIFMHYYDRSEKK